MSEDQESIGVLGWLALACTVILSGTVLAVLGFIEGWWSF